MVYSGAWGKLIHEKNQKSKISWHCPFTAVGGGELRGHNDFDDFDGKNPFREPLERVGPENQDFFGPKKVEIFRAHPFQWPSNCPHQNH